MSKSKNQNNIIYVYRYIWKHEDNKETYNVKILAGVEVEHKDFMSRLLAEEKITNASRLYLHEYNVLMTEQHEKIK